MKMKQDDSKNWKSLERRARGFSLIELMTVVAIMAVLGAIAMPAFQTAMMKAKMITAMSNGKQIALGLRALAQDNGGGFPGSVDMEGNEVSNSNDAFRQLVPDYIDSEKVFEVASSKWGPSADNRFDSEEDVLRPGENHFAYIAGLTDTDRSDWPLIVDGTDGDGNYVSTPGAKGSAWRGKKAVVISMGGAGRVVRLRGDREGPRYIPREGYPDQNALDVSSYMGEDVKLLDPADGE